jgi:hypothetical protein
VFLATYELERWQVLESEEWQRAVDTPWTRRVRCYFQTPSLRNVYERIFPA